ncbi:MAG: hypothetical protein M1351_02685 [Candidatus Thermoplasmatota archaeon]|nr:hypothetical protein [Candidatus Thermoplasmatota archaeon]
MAWSNRRIFVPQVKNTIHSLQRQVEGEIVIETINSVAVLYIQKGGNLLP